MDRFPKDGFSRDGRSGPDRTVSREAVLLVYGLYLARFFTGISMLVGVIVAAFLRRTSRGGARRQLDWFIRVFWYDVAVLIGCGLLLVAITVIEQVISRQHRPTY